MTPPPSPLRLALLFTTAAFLLDVHGSCGGESPGLLEVGTGESSFQSIDANARLPLVAGIQGGHHVWLSFRGDGLDPGWATLELHLEPEDPQYANDSWVRVFVQEDPASESGGILLVGWPARIFDPECVVGQRVVARVALIGDEGGAAEGVGEFIVDPPAGGGLPECAP